MGLFDNKINIYTGYVSPNMILLKSNLTNFQMTLDLINDFLENAHFIHSWL
jgi:hypothetical protein